MNACKDDLFKKRSKFRDIAWKNLMIGRLLNFHGKKIEYSRNEWCKTGNLRTSTFVNEEIVTQFAFNRFGEIPETCQSRTFRKYLKLRIYVSYVAIHLLTKIKYNIVFNVLYQRINNMRKIYYIADLPLTRLAAP